MVEIAVWNDDTKCAKPYDVCAKVCQVVHNDVKIDTHQDVDTRTTQFSNTISCGHKSHFVFHSLISAKVQLDCYGSSDSLCLLSD